MDAGARQNRLRDLDIGGVDHMSVQLERAFALAFDAGLKRVNHTLSVGNGVRRWGEQTLNDIDLGSRKQTTAVIGISLATSFRLLSKVHIQEGISRFDTHIYTHEHTHQSLANFFI